MSDDFRWRDFPGDVFLADLAGDVYRRVLWGGIGFGGDNGTVGLSIDLY